MDTVTRAAWVLLSARVTRFGVTPTRADAILLNAMRHLAGLGVN